MSTGWIVHTQDKYGNHLKCYGKQQYYQPKTNYSTWICLSLLSLNFLISSEISIHLYANGGSVSGWINTKYSEFYRRGNIENRWRGNNIDSFILHTVTGSVMKLHS